MAKACKHILVGTFALVAAALISLTIAASSAWAAGAQPEVKLTPVGDNVQVSIIDEAGKQNDVRALSLTLDIDIEDGTESAVGISFEFSQWVKDHSNIHEQRPNPWSDGHALELYVAGPEMLIPSGSLDLGTVVISYDSSVSPRSVVVVSVPGTGVMRADGATSAGALRLVDGQYKEKADIEPYSQYPAAIALGDAKNDLNGDDPSGDGNGNANGGGNDPQVVNNPLRQNSNLTALAQTGDTLMPLVVTLLCVVALAAATMAFIVIRRRSHKG